jgi:xylulose-5-phosphate/fructose-6-phosphate phosphoketolase
VSTRLEDDEFVALDAYWRAANYLSVGQIYLKSNPLLEEPLKLEHIKPRLLGHWGTTPGLNFVYAHLNRVISARELPMLLVIGPGHGGPALVANTWLEGSYSEIYPDVSRDTEGMRRLFRQFSFPGGIPSHCAPEIPGSIHEGGELGYSLAHAFGAAFDNPQLIVACVVGDGEAETGALAASWHSSKFLHPVDDGAVLPILHLNGWKISNPTVLARMPEEELGELLRGYGWDPRFVGGNEPMRMHRVMAAALDAAVDEIARIKAAARGPAAASAVPRWPMLVLRTPKGWTGPHEVDDVPVEGTWRSHQVPLASLAENPEHLRQLESWMRSYRPDELFTADGAPNRKLLAHVPKGTLRLGATPYANGGVLRRNLRLPDYRDYAVAVPSPGTAHAEATRVLGGYLRDVFVKNEASRNFLLFGPDETESNRLTSVYEATPKRHLGTLTEVDRNLAPRGRVLEILSEHLCQGWLEGYLLTGRHGLFSCYEAFIHIVDSMFNQHAKWLKVAHELPWRRSISSLNYLLTSHVWRQDHNGFSHQDPGFIDHVANKKANVIRVYLPPDANTLLCVADRALRSSDLVNVIVAGKQKQLQYLDVAAAARHCEAGVGIWPWASTDGGGEPEVVLACAGDVPTLETLAAAALLMELFPDLKLRVVNVVDLMALQPPGEHPSALSDRDFDAIFTRDKPIIFAYHGYPWLIHRLTYRRTNHDHLHVRGYKEEGTTTTPFDMTVRNDLDRFHLVGDVAQRVPRLAPRAAYTQQLMRDRLAEHRDYIREHGDDLPSIRDWTWPGNRP